MSVMQDISTLLLKYKNTQNEVPQPVMEIFKGYKFLTKLTKRNYQ